MGPRIAGTLQVFRRPATMQGLLPFRVWGHPGRGTGRRKARPLRPLCLHDWWERREPAVDYRFANGDREAHRIGMEDWPILLQLERARKLTFQNADIRERFQWMKPISDDPS
jgi:hypothetical protein